MCEKRHKTLRREIGDRRQKSWDRRPETGDVRQGTGGVRKETKDTITVRRETGNGSLMQCCGAEIILAPAPLLSLILALTPAPAPVQYPVIPVYCYLKLYYNSQ